MKVNYFLITMAVVSMIFVLLSVLGNSSISTANIITIIMDIAVICLSIKKE